MRISDWSSDVCSSDLIMHWKTKAALFRLFDAMPMGRKAYSLAQQHITKSMPRPTGNFPRYLAQFDEHLRAFERNGAAVEGARYVEFGTGRSEERRVGEEGVHECRSRWST